MTSIKHRTAALVLAALIAATGAFATSAFAADSTYAAESGGIATEADLAIIGPVIADIT